ncbi:MAG: DUF4112 domain-containing protein [Pseudomonadota bacterium]|nr:DUF4112 domain-containing protein [Pseudomonadota bacterium]
MATTTHALDSSAAQRKHRARERLMTLTRLMDSAVDLPILRTKVGLDALLGIIPVAGDLLSAAIGVYLITQARELGASRWLQTKMVGNLIIDATVGAVPLAGDVFDIYFRAHRRNLQLLQQHLGEPYLDAPDVEAIERTERR